jgi:hypothetical protein
MVFLQKKSGRATDAGIGARGGGARAPTGRSGDGLARLAGQVFPGQRGFRLDAGAFHRAAQLGLVLAHQSLEGEHVVLEPLQLLFVAADVHDVQLLRQVRRPQAQVDPVQRQHPQRKQALVAVVTDVAIDNRTEQGRAGNHGLDLDGSLRIDHAPVETAAELAVRGGDEADLFQLQPGLGEVGDGGERLFFLAGAHGGVLVDAGHRAADALAGRVHGVAVALVAGLAVLLEVAGILGARAGHAAAAAFQPCSRSLRVVVFDEADHLAPPFSSSMRALK